MIYLDVGTALGAKIEQRIDTLEAATDVADVVGTYADLENYDTSALTDNSIIKVLQDESNGNTISYYRYSKSTNSFSFIGEIGPFYTKTEIDSSFNETNTNLTNHVDDKENPHAVTKTQVGLDNVDNTSDLDKPISTATQTALDKKSTVIFKQW